MLFKKYYFVAKYLNIVLNARSII